MADVETIWMPVSELPDEIRVPLHSLTADIEYLFGRVAADGSCAPAMANSALDRLRQIEAAVSAIAATVAIERARAEKAEQERRQSHNAFVDADQRALYFQEKAAAAEARAASEYQRGLAESDRIVREEWNAYATTSGVGIEALVAAILNSIRARALQPQPSDASAPKGGA